LLTWNQLLAWHDQPARTWEPKRLRLRLLTVSARLITTGRRRILRLSQRWSWSDLITGGHSRRAAHSELGEPAILCRGTGMSQRTLPTTNPNEPVYNSLAKDRGLLAARSTLARNIAAGARTC
jgi:hypothetical protein